jgi:hypothetical protein
VNVDVWFTVLREIRHPPVLSGLNCLGCIRMNTVCVPHCINTSEAELWAHNLLRVSELPQHTACLASASMSAESTQPSTPLAKAHSLPVLSAGDWMRRGLLAERLYHDIEALQAYRCCLAVTARGESNPSCCIIHF